MVTFYNDLDGPWPGFKGHGIFEVEYLKKTARLADKVPIEHK